MLDSALACAVRRREFAAVHALLRTGYTFGLAGTLAGSQAAEMLERAMFKRVPGVASDAGLVQAS